VPRVGGGADKHYLGTGADDGAAEPWYRSTVVNYEQVRS
jgi:hypothetical protein